MTNTIISGLILFIYFENQLRTYEYKLTVRV